MKKQQKNSKPISIPPVFKDPTIDIELNMHGSQEDFINSPSLVTSPTGMNRRNMNSRLMMVNTHGETVAKKKTYRHINISGVDKSKTQLNVLDRGMFQHERQSSEQILEKDGEEQEKKKPERKRKPNEDDLKLLSEVPLQEIGLAKILLNKPAPHVSAQSWSIYDR